MRIWRRLFRAISLKTGFKEIPQIHWLTQSRALIPLPKNLQKAPLTPLAKVGLGGFRGGLPLRNYGNL
jgi:hypothetical protein